MPDLEKVATPARVTVVDVDMPFGSMVTFIVKWTLAAIPAMLLLAFVAMILAVVFGGIIGAMFARPHL
jgi:ABC-type dipeptide/oligopeptide/nickel transport system permease component